jgi:nicotinamidase-related amidase
VTRALLVIDIQRDYFPGGAYPLVDPEAAAAAARRVLDRFRARQEPIIHLRHVWDAPEATFMRPDTEGVDIHPLVAPSQDEPVIEKTAPNGFVGTRLEALLRTDDINELVVVGMMSSMCVDATVRAAVDVGLAVTVVHDACAAPDLEFGGRTVPGAMVHAAFMASLADGYATVMDAASVLDDESGR